VGDADFACQIFRFMQVFVPEIFPAAGLNEQRNY